MQRKVLAEMGLDKSSINMIMDANGKDIGKAKKEMNTYKMQISRLEADLKYMHANCRQKQADMEFQLRLRDAVTEAGGKNAKAIIALLDTEKLRTSKNQIDDIRAAIAAAKGDAAYLFHSETTYREVKLYVEDSVKINLHSPDLYAAGGGRGELVRKSCSFSHPHV